MNRVLSALVAFLVVSSALAQSPEPAKIRITTWNLEWFPNGSARETTPEKQAQRIQAAADVLKEITPDILLLQEVRDYDACNRLAEAIQPGAYTVAICSAFKGGKQEEAILAKIPAQAAWSEPWKSMEGIDPPRGFAFAWFKIGNADIGVYSLHLKSNLVTHGDPLAETAKNIRKREIAIDQLMTHVRDFIGAKIPTINRFIIGGDFNTNHDQAMVAAEKTLDTLGTGALRSVFDAIPFEQRITHPGTHGFPDATFDYFFGKNVVMGKPIITQTNVSDHLPVNVRRDDSVKPWVMIADNLHKAGWSLGWISALDVQGRTIWIVDAHGYGKRFIVRADEMLTAFVELQRAIHEFSVDLIS